MAGISKRTKLICDRIDPGRQYPIADAVDMLSGLSTVKFKESFDVAINLGIDARKSDQAVRGASLLPNGTGKSVRVAVFAQGSDAEQATAAGAELVGMEDLAERVTGGELDFDVVIATPEAMRLVGRLGQVLGPKGLMPNPKTGTVTNNVGEAVANAKAGQLRFRTDKNGIIQGSIGQVGFEAEAIRANLEALIGDLKRSKPASAKGVYIRKVSLSTTMGPGLVIDLASLDI